MATPTLKIRRTRKRATPTPTQPVTSSTYIVDGIEGDVARVELPDGTTADYPLASLPPGVQEGDVVRVTPRDSVPVGEIDHDATQARRQRAQDTLTALNADAPTGDLDL